MQKTLVFPLLLLAASIAVGCSRSPFDPQHYVTPLPHHHEHVSNGGELGFIGRRDGPSGWTDVVPVSPGPNGEDVYCNEFGWSGDWVVGDAVEYGARAFVDPPLSKRYFVLDTSTGAATSYPTLNDAQQAWPQLAGSAPFPSLARRHATSRPMP